MSRASRPGAEGAGERSSAAERPGPREPGPVLVLRPPTCEAVVFDLDGVVTDTARIHERAWKETFDDLLRERLGEGGFRPFGAEDYAHYVDGKPRYDGVRSFLASRGIELEEGSPEDPPERRTVQGVGNRKNARFREVLAESGPEAYPDALRLLRALREAGVATALISSSKNAAAVLEAAGAAELFDVRVDGREAERQGLAGKPAPDVFLEAARRLGASPARCAALEDAEAGVEAAAAAGFAWVVGVARHGGGAGLREHGATHVVSELGALRVAAEAQASI